MLRTESAESPPVPWTEILRRAQKMPVLWVWSQEKGHLTGPITASLRTVWEKGAFQAPVKGLVRVAPTQCLVSCQGGPVISQLEPYLRIENADILLEALNEADQRLEGSKSRALRGFREDATFHLGACAHVLYLAEYGALAVRDQHGLWCQSYRRGWPTSPPVLLKDDASGNSLMVAAALSPQWFFGLPYAEADVLGAIPEVAKPHVTVEWNDQDVILPEFSPDPEVLLGLRK